MNKQFTEEQYEKSDPLSPANAKPDDYLSMTNMQFSVTHSHSESTVMISQRFDKAFVNGEGFSQAVPHQISIIIPEDYIQIIVMNVIASGLCLQKEKDHESE